MPTQKGSGPTYVYLFKALRELDISSEVAVETLRTHGFDLGDTLAAGVPTARLTPEMYALLTKAHANDSDEANERADPGVALGWFDAMEKINRATQSSGPNVSTAAGPEGGKPDRFQAGVKDRSHVQPVVVEFWEPESAACEAVRMMLARLAKADGSLWRLVRINAEAHPSLRRRFGVDRVPALRLFVNGSAAAALSDVVSESEVREWLAAYLPAPSAQSMPAGGAQPVSAPLRPAKSRRPVPAAPPAIPRPRVTLSRALRELGIDATTVTATLRQHGFDVSDGVVQGKPTALLSAEMYTLLASIHSEEATGPRLAPAKGYTGKDLGRTVTMEELDRATRAASPEGMGSDGATSEAEMISMIDDSMSEVESDQIVVGRVVAITDKEVVVDIGLRSDGVVSKSEFSEVPKVGDEIDVYVDRLEDKRGQLTLSRAKAIDKRRWMIIDEAMESGAVIEGEIVKRIKGGMIVNLLGAEAFLPSSELDVRPVRDFDVYLGKRMEFRVVKTNPANGDIVISHKALIEKDLQHQRTLILDSLEVGQVLEGQVRNIVDFGVFVDLGGVDGLLHITDLSWGRVGHPSEVVELDQKLNVVVLDYDRERQRISLGYKQLQRHPWDDLETRIRVGSVVEGRAVKVKKQRLVVEIERGVDMVIEAPERAVTVGETVRAEVARFDVRNKTVSGMLRPRKPVAAPARPADVLPDPAHPPRPRVTLARALRELSIDAATALATLRRQGFAPSDGVVQGKPTALLTAEMHDALVAAHAPPEPRADAIRADRYALAGPTVVGRVEAKSAPPRRETAPMPSSLFVRLTTTGARQVLRYLGDGAASSAWDDDGREDRTRAVAALRSAFGHMPTAFLSRLADVDRESGLNKLSLRLPTGDGASVDLLLARKPRCLLVIGAKRSDAQRFLHEVEIAPRLQIDADCDPPIAPALLSRLEALPTQEERADEVDERLKRWIAYLDVEQRHAEAQKFSAPFESVHRHDAPGRIRVTLADGLPAPLLDQVAGHRDRVFITLDDDERRPTRVATATVRSFARGARHLTLDLDEDDATSLRAGRLTLPREGLIVNEAAGSLAMIRRQQDAINRLKLHGAALPDLDRILFGGNDDLPLTPFPPVEPIPLDECLAQDRINERQRLAVALALNTPDCLFLQGPPGTGKTTVIAELCYQLAKRGQRVLVASQANLAVDNALSRLQDSREILAVRMGPSDKVEEDAQEFVGDRAVSRWLRSVQSHTRTRIATLDAQIAARAWFGTHRAALKAWAGGIAEQTAAHQALLTEAKALGTDATRHDAAAACSAETAERLGALAAALASDSAADDRDLWEHPDAEAVRQGWAHATASVRSGIAAGVSSPWTLASDVETWADALGSDSDFDAAVRAGRSLLSSGSGIEAAERNVRTAHRAAQQAFDQAEQQVATQQARVAELRHVLISRRATTRQISQGTSLAVLEPSWVAIEPETSYQARLSSRLARAERLVKLPSGDAGARRQPHHKPEELIVMWYGLERQGRSGEAERALQALEAATASLSDKATQSLFGTVLHRAALDRHLTLIREMTRSLRSDLEASAEKMQMVHAFVRMERAAYVEQLDTVVQQEIDAFTTATGSLDGARGELVSLGSNLEVAKAEAQALITQTIRLIEALRDEVGVATGLTEMLDDLVHDARRQPGQAYADALDALDEADQSRRDVLGQARVYRMTAAAAQADVLSDAQDAASAAHGEAGRAAGKAGSCRKQAAARQASADEITEVLSASAGLWADARHLAPALTLPDLPAPGDVEAAEQGATGGLTNARQAQKTRALLSDWADRLEAGGDVGDELAREFHRRANVVGVTCAHSAKKSFYEQFPEFDVVIVDEVSKATPTELLLPALLGRRVVLVGDHRQLPPIFGKEGSFAEAAEALGLDAKQFEENLKTSLFKERYEYLASLSDAGGDGAAAQGARAVMLTTQYRMHSHIMEGINQFYDDKLELGRLGPDEVPLDDDRHHGLDCPPWLCPDDHLVWIDTPLGRDWAHTQEGTTRHNEREVEVIRRVLEDLIGASGAEALDIGVTSVYAAQVSRLRSSIDKAGFSNESLDRLRVSTVDRFQGMERDVMVVSLVLNGPGHTPGGFLRTPERINVAMSRARRLLVIVGSSHNYCELSAADNPYARFYSVARQLGRVVDASHLLHS